MANAELSPRVPEHSVEGRFISLRQQIGHLAVVRGNVPYFGSFWQAYDYGLRIDDALVEATYEIAGTLVHLDRQPKVDQAFNDAYKANKSIQAEEVKLFPESYPRGRKEKEGWFPALFERLARDKVYREAVTSNLFLPIASTVPNRFSLFRAVIANSGVEAPLQVAEFGCGLNINLAKWAYVDRQEHDLNYPPIEVVKPAKKGSPELVKDTEATASFNDAVNTNLDLDIGIGIDLFNARRDDKFRMWGVSNTKRPADYIDPSYTAELDLLIDYALHPPEIIYCWADYSERMDLGDLKRQVGTDKVDYVLFSNTLYQESEENVKLALANAESLARRGVGVFERRALTSHLKYSNGRPIFPEATDGYQESLDYSLHFKNMEQANEGYQQHLLVNDPRPERVMTLPAFHKAIARRP